jgi:small subunit ribosomal protein S20
MTISLTSPKIRLKRVAMLTTPAAFVIFAVSDMEAGSVAQHSGIQPSAAGRNKLHLTTVGQLFRLKNSIIFRKEQTTLATHKSAIKRARQNKDRNLRNKSNRTRVKSVIKDVRAAIEENSSEKAQTALASAIPVIDKAAQRGAIHQNTASRKISRLTKQVNQIQST